MISLPVRHLALIAERNTLISHILNKGMIVMVVLESQWESIVRLAAAVSNLIGIPKRVWVTSCLRNNSDLTQVYLTN